MGVNTDLEVLTPASELETNIVLEAPIQLPFNVEEAVLDNVAKFLQQQQTMMMQLEGPPDPSS